MKTEKSCRQAAESETEVNCMAWEIAGAFLIAAGFSVIFGKRCISWLKEHGNVQPIKPQVNDNIYNENEESSDES